MLPITDNQCEGNIEKNKEPLSSKISKISNLKAKLLSDKRAQKHLRHGIYPPVSTMAEPQNPPHVSRKPGRIGLAPVRRARFSHHQSESGIASNSTASCSLLSDTLALTGLRWPCHKSRATLSTDVAAGWSPISPSLTLGRRCRFGARDVDRFSTAAGTAGAMATPTRPALTVLSGGCNSAITVLRRKRESVGVKSA
ncbi:unnamed protein product, partial [Vitis vinifera]